MRRAIQSFPKQCPCGMIDKMMSDRRHQNIVSADRYLHYYNKYSRKIEMNRENKIALVDIDDNIIGFETKEEVHRRGLLHRAFSVFILRDGKMLIQMRNPDKYHSGGLWSNACCSHQRDGEELAESVHRRMTEELGFDCHLEEKFSFVYRTQFRPDLIEYEYDHVFAGSYDGEVRVNPEEASQITSFVVNKWATHKGISGSQTCFACIYMC